MDVIIANLIISDGIGFAELYSAVECAQMWIVVITNLLVDRKSVWVARF